MNYPSAVFLFSKYYFELVWGPIVKGMKNKIKFKKKDNPNLCEFVHLFVARLTKNYNESKKA